MARAEGGVSADTDEGGEWMDSGNRVRGLRRAGAAPRRAASSRHGSLPRHQHRALPKWTRSLSAIEYMFEP